MDYKELQVRINKVRFQALLEDFQDFQPDRVPPEMKDSLRHVCMYWRPNESGVRELAIKQPGQHWQHYSQSSLAQPDGPNPMESPGIRTYQFCHRRGARLLNDEQYRRTLIVALIFTTLRLPWDLVRDLGTMLRLFFVGVR